MTVPEGHNYYEGHSGEEYQRAVHGDVLESRRTFEAKSRLAAHRYFEDVPQNHRILEFGVGVGTNLASIPQRIRDGYDVSEFARSLSSQAGVRVFESIDEIPVSSYDLVLCRHVLEHVEDPVGMLKLLSRFVAPDGIILLIVPIESTLGTPRRLPDVDTDNHLFAWGPQHIVNVLNIAGLAPVKHRFFWYSMQAKLAPVLDVLGLSAYSAMITIAGHLRRQRELAIWVRPRG